VEEAPAGPCRKLIYVTDGDQPVTTVVGPIHPSEDLDSRGSAEASSWPTVLSSMTTTTGDVSGSEDQARLPRIGVYRTTVIIVVAAIGKFRDAEHSEFTAPRHL